MKSVFLTALSAALAVSAISSFASTADDGKMFPFVIRANGKNPAMDMSSLLPAPAGRDGFVRSQGEHFVTDSGKIRFNGVNLVGPANFPEYKAADRLAERLSRLGINCVRMHFFDVSEYGSNFMEAPRPGIYNEDESSSGILVEERLDRLYYLVSALKRRGIYLNMNLHVGREFDERDGFPKATWANRGLGFFYEPLLEKEKEYAKMLLGRVNPHTGLRLADDPCVAFVEINNENGLFSVWPCRHFDDDEKFPKVYRDALDARWNEWLEKRYRGDLAALERAWGWKPQPFGQNPYVRCAAPGPAYPAAVTNDFYRFLADTDSAYFRNMREFLRKDIGVKSVITATQLDYCTPHTLAESDAVDVHLYWTHPLYGEIPKGINIRKGPHRGVKWIARNQSILSSTRYEEPYNEDFVPHRATMRVKGKPFLVSETAAPYPNWYGAEFQPFIHALGAFQDWGGVILHSWNNDPDPEPERTTFFFSYAGRTDCVAHFPAVAAIYLRGDVRPALERIDVNDAKEDYFRRLFRITHRHAGVHSSPARITGGRFRSSEVFLRGLGVDLEGKSPEPKPISAAARLEMDAGVYRSDTGEIVLDRSDCQHATFKVKTRNVKLFTGFTMPRKYDLGDGVTLSAGLNRLGWCTVSLTSMNADGFKKGSRILLAATGMSHNGGARFTREKGAIWHSRDEDFGWSKTVTEGVSATIELPVPGAVCRALDEDGEPVRDVPVKTVGGKSVIDLGPEFRTVWYEVKL